MRAFNTINELIRQLRQLNKDQEHLNIEALKQTNKEIRELLK